jgi:hypothetical protein
MIKAYAAFEPGGELQPFEYEPGPLGAHEVESLMGQRSVSGSPVGSPVTIRRML